MPVGRNSRRCWAMAGRKAKEPAGNPSKKRTRDVHDQRPVGEPKAEQARSADVDAVAQGAADPRAEEDDQVEHQRALSSAEQFFDLAVTELHPGRSAVIALARSRGDLHL